MHGQFCGYLKTLFCNATTRYGTKKLFPDVIEREAIKAWPNAHCQNNLHGQDIALKTTQVFLKTSYQLYRAKADCLQENFLFNQNMHGQTRCYPNTVVRLLESPRLSVEIVKYAYFLTIFKRDNSHRHSGFIY